MTKSLSQLKGSWLGTSCVTSMWQELQVRERKKTTWWLRSDAAFLYVHSDTSLFLLLAHLPKGFVTNAHCLTSRPSPSFVCQSEFDLESNLCSTSLGQSRKGMHLYLNKTPLEGERTFHTRLLAKSNSLFATTTSSFELAH